LNLPLKRLKPSNSLNGSSRYFLCPTHVFAKHFGNKHAPVGLLEIFKNGNDGSAYGET
jgi:hypothetical protein